MVASFIATTLFHTDKLTKNDHTHQAITTNDKNWQLKAKVAMRYKNSLVVTCKNKGYSCYENVVCNLKDCIA